MIEKPLPPPVPPIAMQPRWEYRVIIVNLKFTSHTEDQLNDLGRDGWEAVGILPEGSQTMALLKRRVKR